MKKTLSLIVLIFILVPIYSQVDTSDEDKKVGGFAAILINSKLIENKTALIVGGGGGFIVKDIRLGVYFEGLASKVSIKDKNDNNNTHRFSVSYGGLWIGYPLWKTKRIHALADLKLSIGKTATQRADNLNQDNDYLTYGISPFLGGEFYITYNLAISAGFDYSFFFYPARPEIYNKNILNTPSFRIGIKLGHFREW